MQPDDGTTEEVRDAQLLAAKKMAAILLKNEDIQAVLTKDDAEEDPASKLNQYKADGTLKGKDNRAKLEEQIAENETGCIFVMSSLAGFVEQKIYEILRAEGLATSD